MANDVHTDPLSDPILDFSGDLSDVAMTLFERLRLMEAPQRDNSASVVAAHHLRIGEDASRESLLSADDGTTLTAERSSLTNGETVVGYNDRRAVYRLYTGDCEHSDYKAGHLMNYLGIAVKAKSSYVGKILVWLLHEIINGHDPEDILSYIDEELRETTIPAGGLTINGEQLNPRHYPVSVVLDFIAGREDPETLTHDLNDDTTIKHERRSRNGTIIIERHVANIDVWDLTRLGIAYDVWDWDVDYRNW